MDTKVQAGDGSKHEERRKSKRSRPVTVKIIRREGASALVEWRDKVGLHRAFVPAKELSGNDIDKEVLAQGIPYGEDWAAHFEKFPNADAIAVDLRRRGIWTAYDFRRYLVQVRAAVLKASVNPALSELNHSLEV